MQAYQLLARLRHLQLVPGDKDSMFMGTTEEWQKVFDDEREHERNEMASLLSPEHRPNNRIITEDEANNPF